MDAYGYLEHVVATKVLNERELVSNKLVEYVSRALELKGYPSEDIRKVVLGVYVMDIGLHINNTKDMEFEYHPIRGCIFIGVSPELEMVKNIVLLHHENFIGTGYPYGLKGDKVPEYVQIVSICNEFTLNSECGLLKDEIIKKMKRRYNPKLVEFLEEMIFI